VHAGEPTQYASSVCKSLLRPANWRTEAPRRRGAPLPVTEGTQQQSPPDGGDRRRGQPGVLAPGGLVALGASVVQCHQVQWRDARRRGDCVFAHTTSREIHSAQEGMTWLTTLPGPKPPKEGDHRGACSTLPFTVSCLDGPPLPSHRNMLTNAIETIASSGGSLTSPP